MFRERRYTSIREDWKKYNHWKRTRNPARAKLEAEYGYDTKHGAHLVRLLRMGREILETGEVHVWRGGPDGPNDREELLAIRGGEWDYDQLVGWAEEQDEDLKRMYDAREYVVRSSPRRVEIDDLCQQMVEEALD